MLPSIMEKLGRSNTQLLSLLQRQGRAHRGRGYMKSLGGRRWARRLSLFYKIVNKRTPAYMLQPIPPLQQTQNSFRRGDVIGQIRARTERFKSSFYAHCLKEWNIVDPQIRNASSVDAFKKYLVLVFLCQC